LVGVFFIFNIAMSYPNVDNFEAQIKILILNLNFMKKLKRILVASAFLIAFTSCEKNEIQQNENTQATNPDRTQNEQIDESTIIDRHLFPELYVENGVLTFASIEYYESLVDEESQQQCIDQLTNYLNESAFNSYGKNHITDSEFQDRFMDAIMNEDKVVKIGKWLIYIDPTNEIVKAISDEVSNAYTILLGNTQNEDIIEMTTTDDVLDELSEGSGQDRNGLCGESGVASRDEQEYFGSPNEGTNRAILEHRKYGIYFKIQVRIFTPLVANQMVKFNFTKKSYKKTCQTMVNMTLGNYSTPSFNGGAYDYVLTHGTRNFNKYWIRIETGERGTTTFGYVKESDLSGPLEIRANM
jgi:uncharacterized protein YxeA